MSDMDVTEVMMQLESLQGVVEEVHITVQDIGQENTKIIARLDKIIDLLGDILVETSNP